MLNFAFSRISPIVICCGLIPVVYAKNQASPDLFIQSAPSQKFVWSDKDENLSSQHKFLLALKYEKNKSKQDLALKYLKDSARLGYAKAQYHLGKKYYQGEMLNKDFQQARLWFKKAAAQGYIKAQFKLALMLQNAQGGPRNDSQAIKLLKIASENGLGEAQHALAVNYLQNPKYQNIERAIFWLQKSVEQDNADAKRDLGFLYFDGSGVNKNFRQAMELLETPAQQGNPMSQYLMGEILSSGGYGIRKQPEKSRYWYTLALQSGYMDAKIGIQKLNGKSRSFSVKQATPKPSTDFKTALIYDWKQAWQSKNFGRYKSFYSQQFKNQSKNYHSWIKYRRKIIQQSNNIQIEISNLTVKPKNNNRVLVKFYQKYQSETFSDKVLKEQYWQKGKDNRWQIVYEGAVRHL